MTKLEAPVRWSNLKHVAKSPAHYRYVVEHPEEFQPTKGMRIGGYVNSLTIGGHFKFVEYPGRRQGKAWDEFEAAVPAGTDVVTETEAKVAKGIAESVLASPWYAELLGGHVEERLLWSVGNRECCGTPDAFVPGEILTDLKVTADASPDRFMWHAVKQGWFAQLAWYARALGDAAPKRVFILAAESKPPFCIVPYELTEAALLSGTKTWRILFERLMVSEQSNAWPGYAESIIPLDGPMDDYTPTLDGEED